MKLWILMDETIDEVKISKKDIIFTNSVEIERLYSGNQTVFFNKMIVNEDPSISVSINKMFENISDQYQILKNEMYARIFQPMIAVTTQVEEILRFNSIEEINLVGGSEYIFMTMRHGAGEGTSKLYKLSWMVCPFLYLFYKDRTDVVVKWHKKKPKLVGNIFHYLRETALYLREVIKVFKNCTLLNDNKSSIVLDNGKKSVVVITQKMLQYRHLSHLLSNLKDINVIHITQSSEVDSTDTVIAHKYNLRCALRIMSESLESTIINKEVSFSYSNCSIKINKATLNRILRPEILSTQKTTNMFFATIDIFNIKPDYIVTNMTFGSEINEIYNYCIINNIEHINFQYVGMQKMLYPNIELANRYYMYAHKAFEFYSNYSNSYYYYLPIGVPNKKKINQIPIVTLFTQPDWYADRYISFLEDFCLTISKNKIDITLQIKPHYRQNKMNSIIEIVKRYKFAELVDSSYSVAKLLRNSDYAMSMTSSVLFEAVSVGTPAFIIDIDGKDSYTISNNDVCFEDVNFRCKTINEIVNYFVDANKTLDIYKYRRESFIKQSSALTNIEDVFKSVE